MVKEKTAIIRMMSLLSVAEGGTAVLILRLLQCTPSASQIPITAGGSPAITARNSHTFSPKLGRDRQLDTWEQTRYVCFHFVCIISIFPCRTLGMLIENKFGGKSRWWLETLVRCFYVGNSVRIWVYTY